LASFNSITYRMLNIIYVIRRRPILERERLKTKASGSRQGKSQARQQVRPIVDAGPAETPTVKSAARALRVLELFDELRRDARVAEISMRLGYPQSSTSVLLKCLEKAGYLD